MGYELDGTTNQDPILGIIVINPTFDSVAEVKQANQNFDAEFSYTGGGIATYSTKSGTNDFHGDAFEYLQVNTPGFRISPEPLHQPARIPPTGRTSLAVRSADASLRTSCSSSRIRS
jgi:hypothetical protein